MHHCHKGNKDHRFDGNDNNHNRLHLNSFLEDRRGPDAVWGEQSLGMGVATEVLDSDTLRMMVFI